MKAPSMENPLSHPIWELDEFPFLLIIGHLSFLPQSLNRPSQIFFDFIHYLFSIVHSEAVTGIPGQLRGLLHWRRHRHGRLDAARVGQQPGVKICRVWRFFMNCSNHAFQMASELRLLRPQRPKYYEGRHLQPPRSL